MAYGPPNTFFSVDLLASTVSLGNSYTCAILTDNTIRCWGQNNWGQLGNRRNTDSATPVEVSGISTAAQISAASFHACALLGDDAATDDIDESGTVQCWGLNFFGQLGDGTNTPSNIPVTVSGLRATAVSTLIFHTCALLEDDPETTGIDEGGTVQCWGDNSNGQLGDGTTTGSNIPVDVTGITTATAIVTGFEHTCVLHEGGTVQCWGNNSSGQLGDGTNISSNTPVDVMGINSAIAISAGSIHTCVLLESGTVQCWGDNENGKLGNTPLTNNGGDLSRTPVDVSDITTATAISPGTSQTCALLGDDAATGDIDESGTVQCWGSNRFGQLGDGTNIDSTTPVDVSGITNAAVIVTGNVHTCAVLEGGTAQCWGQNTNGQLGSPGQIFSSTPVQVRSITTASAVSAGTAHTCAVLEGGTAQCWGSGRFGQLGDGMDLDSDIPVAVSEVSTAAVLSTGGDHTCAVLEDDSTTAGTDEGGTVQCWGSNFDSQLGDGTSTDSNIPVSVMDIDSATAVSLGTDHSCALLQDNTIECWGANSLGQLGIGSNTNRSRTPAAVSGIDTATAISVGSGSRDVGNVHSCALLQDNTIECWGINASGQLGDGTNINSNIPVNVMDIDSAIQVSAGSDHTCALIDDGTANDNTGSIMCWGINASGQLGDGTNINSNIPVNVMDIDSAIRVSAGGAHTCALLEDGTVQCWGRNTIGQLGNGSLVSSTTPVPVLTITTATMISSGSGHTCSLLADIGTTGDIDESGTVQCWGSNASGKLGIGSLANSNIPLTVSL